ncbi:hypothetical protein [Desulfosporosinus sp. FKB]|uniref:hypothetical protein n=1 Tax=Desulfosporosinus sp. FKB TaxID=1969835 RepID=UPI000B4978BB|nr:hypothetical protein [Desulfosporosinus sp. FKB]
MKIKLSAVLVVLMMVMSMLPVDALASNSNQDANSVLSSFLLATQKNDINQMISLSNDSRVSSTSRVEFYSQILENQSEQLTSYKILTQEILSRTSRKYITELTFKNGDLSQVPFTVSNFNGQWKVIVTPGSLEDSKFKVLKGENMISGRDDTNPTTVTTSQNLISPAALTSLCSWSFTGLYTTLYSTNSFNINSVYSQVLLQGHQYSTDRLSGYVPNIQYAVVQPNWYGDTVWGSTNYTGSGYYSFLINGSSKTFSNAKLRFTRVGGGQYDKADGDGNVYNN